MPKTPYYSRMTRLITTGKFTHDTVRTFECGQYNYFIQKIEDEDDTLYCLFIDIEPESISREVYCIYIDEYLESVVGALQIYQLGFYSNTTKQIEDCMTGDTIKVKFIDEEDEEEEETEDEEDEEDEMPELSAFAFDLTDLLSEEGFKELFDLILKELDKEIERREKKNLPELDKDDVKEEEKDDEEFEVLSDKD